MVGNLQRQIGHRARIKKAALEVLAEPQGSVATVSKPATSDEFLITPEDQVTPGKLGRLGQQVQVPFGHHGRTPDVLFPHDNPFTEVHPRRQQFGLLPVKGNVGAGIKERLDIGTDELRDGPVHGDHRNVCVVLQRKILGGCPQGNDKHRSFLNVAALIEVMHMRQTCNGYRVFWHNIHLHCPCSFGSFSLW
ncbi:hypothetical protein D3C84_728260 [compost metagenome]